MAKKRGEEVIAVKQKVLNNARSYLGTRQGDHRHKTLIDQYNAVKPLPVGYPMKYTDDWCAAFVTVMGDIAGASKYIGRECGVQRFKAIFKQKDIWQGLIQPTAGDVVVFDWQKNGWADHIGFVEKVEGNTITTIEGNTSKQVARRTYPWNDWRIAGYARPQYPSNQKTSNSSIQELANEVIRGDWGDGDERKSRLQNAGHDAEGVQQEVNRLLQRNSKRKSNETIAQEVIQGKWGDGDQRKELLTEAGYDYAEVQKIVNQLM